MAQARFPQRAERILRFLMGLRHARAAYALAAHGFTTEDIAEGWALLQKTTRQTLDKAPPNVKSRDYPGELAAWDRTWLSIARITLTRRAPEALSWLLPEAPKKAQRVPILRAHLFLERWDLLTAPKRKGGFGPGGAEVRALLEARGLSPEVIDEGRALVAGVEGRGEAAEKANAGPPIDETVSVFADAERAAWAWYLEWSGVARAAIRDRLVLHLLGLRRGRGPAAASEGEENEEEGEAEEAAGKDG